MDIEKVSFDGFELVPAPQYALSLEAFRFESSVDIPHGSIRCQALIPALEIVQYGTAEDNKVAVYTEYVTLKMDPDIFAVGFLPLPKAPRDLRYCSFDDFFAMEPGDFWVYDFKSGAFIDTSAFITENPASVISAYMIDHNYNEDNYGSEWVALVADD